MLAFLAVIVGVVVQPLAGWHAVDRSTAISVYTPVVKASAAAVAGVNVLVDHVPYVTGRWPTVVRPLRALLTG